ncbi:MAG: hypothetical protein MI975_20620 [Cytophagales bacterium]|nr:hypothetical protein [Cytophagales bacterium]
MKKSFLFVGLIFFAFCAKGQCDNPFYKLKNGTVIVTESFDKKDKLQSRSETRVIEYDETASGYAATISYEIYDKKDKLISEGDYKLECDRGTIKIDMSSLVPAESMAAFKDMEVEVDMDKMQYPAGLTVGQNLEDASINIKTNNSPIPMSMNMDITNRKVEGKESISTPAGTFDCYKISYNLSSKMSFVKMNLKNIEYISENSGVVKTESYKSGGNLASYTLLTKYEY